MSEKKVISDELQFIRGRLQTATRQHGREVYIERGGESSRVGTDHLHGLDKKENEEE